MSNSEIVAKVTELQELRRMQEELSATIESIQDELKATMGDSETLRAGPYKITYKPVTTTRLDTAALRKALPDVVERFTKTTTSRRFLVA